MISRYSRKKMVAIWEPQNKFQIWLDIETYACEAQARLGIIPSSVIDTLKEKGSFNIPRIEQIELEVKHDIIAFLTNLAEYIGSDAKFIHQGMTSSDVLDTTLSIQLSQASDILLQDIDDLLTVIKVKAEEHKTTICIGRSHGIHAEPTTFGLKLASFYEEFKRNKIRLLAAKEEISTCAISGAVGTFANIDPSVEEYVASKLSLNIEPVSTQVIPRDRHAMFFVTLGVIASSVERLATEIRHLQRSEVMEVQEHFSKGQKGSSAMPHKKNPILSENLTGLARMVRSYALPAMENVALWHERDISHSSVERMIAPDATITLDFALYRLKGLIENLVVYPNKMIKNLNALHGTINSQRVLLALTQAGLSREDAYKVVQNNAMKAFDGNIPFKNLLLQDAEVTTHLTSEEIDNLFDTTYHTKHVNTIFNRVFGKVTKAQNLKGA